MDTDRMTVLTVALTKGEWSEAVCALNSARNALHSSGTHPAAALALELDLERIAKILGRAA